MENLATGSRRRRPSRNTEPTPRRRAQERRRQPGGGRGRRKRESKDEGPRHGRRELGARGIEKKMGLAPGLAARLEGPALGFMIDKDGKPKHEEAGF